MTSRESRLEQFGDGPRRVAEALEGFPREMWSFRPAAGDWSIHELVIHLADSELHGLARLRKAIAEPGGPVSAWDQEAWPVAIDYLAESPDEALRLFSSLRAIAAAVYQRLAPDDWVKSVEHPEWGAMTVERILDTYAGHVDAHIEQMMAVHRAWLVSMHERS
jgi:hypothetical protein